MSIAQLRHERRRTQAPISHHKRHRARGWVVPGVLLQTGLTAHRARGQPSSGSTYDLAEISGQSFIPALSEQRQAWRGWGQTLYYFSAGFLTFKQSEFASCLNADRPLLRRECRVAARGMLMAASDTWNPSCVAEAQLRAGVLVLSRSIWLVKM